MANVGTQALPALSCVTSSNLCNLTEFPSDILKVAIIVSASQTLLQSEAREQRLFRDFLR
jgi:hypothetical protein